MTTRTGWTSLIVVSAIFAALLACKKKREPLSFIADPPIAEGKNYTLTVGTARECAVKEKHYAPKRGFVHLGVEVTFEAKTEELVSIQSYPLKLKAPDGQIYGTSLGQCQPEFPVGTYIKKGRRQHGLLTFEIPENSTSFVLSYEYMVNPSVGMDPVAIILKL